MAPSNAPLLWGGRFSGTIDDRMFQFNESLSFDKVLYKADIQGSIAWAKALNKIKIPDNPDKTILSDHERDQIVDGLKAIEEEWKEGKFEINFKSDEDIHTANERRLGEVIKEKAAEKTNGKIDAEVGRIAGKLHTGRSRNEQVGVDMRLWAREQLTEIEAALKEVLSVSASKAEATIDILMPGYTHLQRAQPVRFSHWLLSHATFLRGDLHRLDGVQERLSSCPLGVGALAGNPFGIDREFMAKELGFLSVHPNSLCAVADRDFVVDILQWASLLMTHLSRLAEDLILFSTAEFGFVQVDDKYSTGSSLMPQKKNPDSLELIRGKAGRVMGQAYGFLASLKSLPTSYNKDLQESVEPLIDCIKTVSDSVEITRGVLETLKVNGAKMKAALTDDMLATDIADYLVLKGIPFRDTHHLAGEIVKKAEDAGVSISALSLEDFKAVSPQFEADIFQVFDFERSVEQRSTFGGTSRSSVEAQIKAIRALVDQ